MKYVGVLAAAAWLCAAGIALGADRTVHLEVPPPVQKDIAAMPQIANPPTMPNAGSTLPSSAWT